MAATAPPHPPTPLPDEGMIESRLRRLRDPNPLRVAVLSNPRSGRNRKVMDDVRRLLANRPEVDEREASSPLELGEALRDLAPNAPEVLIINGGDGTVQAVLTALLNDKPSDGIPALALLRGGTTNMTAGDVGVRGAPPNALGRLLERLDQSPRAVRPMLRPVVRVRGLAGDEPRCGMFFGAGAIVRGIEYFHANVGRLGVTDELGPGLTIARGIIAVARRDDRIAAPVPLAFGVDGDAPGATRDTLLLLVSTLERLFLGMHPYWGKESAPLRLTWIGSRPRRMFLAVPALMRGQPNRFGTPDAGYRSHNGSNFELRIDGPVTLDGEIYRAGADGRPLQLSAAGPVLFLRP
jgi:hypothetical protein